MDDTRDDLSQMIIDCVGIVGLSTEGDLHRALEKMRVMIDSGDDADILVAVFAVAGHRIASYVAERVESKKGKTQ